MQRPYSLHGPHSYSPRPYSCDWANTSKPWGEILQTARGEILQTTPEGIIWTAEAKSPEGGMNGFRLKFPAAVEEAAAHSSRSAGSGQRSCQRLRRPDVVLQDRRRVRAYVNGYQLRFRNPA